MSDQPVGPRLSEDDAGRGLWVGLALGLPVMAWGVKGLLAVSRRVDPPELGRWIVGLALAHDTVLVPLVLLVGFVARRLVPTIAWPPVRWALVTSGVAVLLSWPFVRGYGRTPLVPSLLDRDYGDKRDQVELSVKALLPKPYAGFKAVTAIGSKVSGRVSGMNDSFAYVALAGGAKGAIHISKLAPRRLQHPSDAVTVGQTVECIVLGYDDPREQVQLALVPGQAAPPPPTSPAVRPPPSIAPHPPAPRTVRGEGRTIEEATANAAATLGVPTSAVRVRVLRQPKVGLLGRVKEVAIVEATTM